MTKLEWCRENAPEALKDFPDDELLSLMESSYNRFCEDKETIDSSELESVEYPLNITNNHLDYMVLELTRAFGNNLAFKGGYMLTKLMPNSARQTTDIDFSILSGELYEDIKTKLIAIGEHFKAQGIIADYKIKDTIQPTMSGGADYYAPDGSKMLGVDVGWHDITYGTKSMSIDVGDLRAFEIERMLADKVSAILSKKRFRRPKDIYDLFCISELFDFNISKISNFILRRTNGLGADWQNYPFNPIVVREYEKAYNSLQVNSIYKGKVMYKPTFDAVYSRFCIIAEAVRDTTDDQLVWRHDYKSCWR